MAEDLDTLVDQFTAFGTNTPALPGVLLKAIDGTGKVIYSKKSGRRGPAPDAAPLDFSNTIRIASCSKLITAIAALQCVERGLIGLDDPVDKILPELTTQPVISEDAATKELQYEPRRNAITLRRLLTHTSGVGYDMIDPRLKKWRAQCGEKALTLSTRVLEAFSTPLVFEPGEGWAYGGGVDWAGVLVERVNGGMDLETYMEANIFKPLGMASTTFRLKRKPHVRKALVQMASRRPDGSLTNAKRLIPDPPVDCGGGNGLYSSLPDYMAVLQDLLQAAPTLLKRESVDELFKAQLAPSSPAHMALMAQVPLFQAMVGGAVTQESDLNVGLGGLLITKDVPDVGIRKGTLTWGGAGNLVWFANRATNGGKGLAAMYVSQFMPSGDERSETLIRAFIKEVWSRVDGD